MFPNDDICSTKQAKQAALRIFQKYQSPINNMGQLQVSSLMKDTYKALNMDYNPNKSDVNGLLGVLDHNGDGAISLQDLQKLAVKYLCGQDNVLSNLKIELNPENLLNNLQSQKFKQESSVKDSNQNSQDTKQKSEENFSKIDFMEKQQPFQEKN